MQIVVIGYAVILLLNFFFNIIGNAVLGPETFKEAAAEGLSSSIKISVPLAIVLTVGYLYSLTLD
ncbi:hypothetical protein [Paenibacillus polymyxa]|uniref:hypothetical protein n=1 Tax=Paenibacillus polymyxa TaxID=1406 RepID=UPI0011197180|nr:hypothetical protein [Paenibacillus polymyxa]QDA30266.1 hypothetical protein FGY93_25480 [Paenibacillus polymyxa]